MSTLEQHTAQQQQDLGNNSESVSPSRKRRRRSETDGDTAKCDKMEVASRASEHQEEVLLLGVSSVFGVSWDVY